jgi:hypothetical protein
MADYPPKADTVKYLSILIADSIFNQILNAQPIQNP